MEITIAVDFKRESTGEILKANQVIEDFTDLELLKYSGLYIPGKIDPEKIAAEIKEKQEKIESEKAEALRIELEKKTQENLNPEDKTDPEKTEDKTDPEKTEDKTDSEKTENKTDSEKTENKTDPELEKKKKDQTKKK